MCLGNFIIQVSSSRFLSQGNMSYKDLLAGLIFEGESFQALNNFTFMNYTNVQFCDDAGTPVSQRSGGICLLTNKRILFLSSQLTVGKYNSLLNIFFYI